MQPTTLLGEYKEAHYTEEEVVVTLIEDNGTFQIGVVLGDWRGGGLSIARSTLDRAEAEQDFGDIVKLIVTGKSFIVARYIEWFEHHDASPFKWMFMERGSRSIEEVAERFFRQGF